MFTPSDQSKIKTNAWRDNIICNAGKDKRYEHVNKGRQTKKNAKNEKNTKTNNDNNTNIYQQANCHLKSNAYLLNLIICISLIIIGYILYSLSAGSYFVADYLYFILKPQYSISEDGSQDWLITLFFWVGVTIFNVTILINALPLKIIDSVPGAIFFFLLLFLPLILLWGLWPFSIILKIAWTLWYFMVLRVLYYWAT